MKGGVRARHLAQHGGGHDECGDVRAEEPGAPGRAQLARSPQLARSHPPRWRRASVARRVRSAPSRATRTETALCWPRSTCARRTRCGRWRARARRSRGGARRPPARRRSSLPLAPSRPLAAQLHVLEFNEDTNEVTAVEVCAQPHEVWDVAACPSSTSASRVLVVANEGVSVHHAALLSLPCLADADDLLGVGGGGPARPGPKPAPPEEVRLVPPSSTAGLMRRALWNPNGDAAHAVTVQSGGLHQWALDAGTGALRPQRPPARRLCRARPVAVISHAVRVCPAHARPCHARARAQPSRRPPRCALPRWRLGSARPPTRPPPRPPRRWRLRAGTRTTRTRWRAAACAARSPRWTFGR